MTSIVELATMLLFAEAAGADYVVRDIRSVLQDRLDREVTGSGWLALSEEERRKVRRALA